MTDWEGFGKVRLGESEELFCSHLNWNVYPPRCRGVERYHVNCRTGLPKVRAMALYLPIHRTCDPNHRCMRKVQIEWHFQSDWVRLEWRPSNGHPYRLRFSEICIYYEHSCNRSTWADDRFWLAIVWG